MSQKIIDFSACPADKQIQPGATPISLRTYEQSGIKKEYLVKGPELIEDADTFENVDRAGINEYVTSSVFQHLGIRVQRTVQGTLNLEDFKKHPEKEVPENGKVYVTGCENFLKEHEKLVTIKQIFMDSPEKKLSCNMEDVLSFIDSQEYVNKEELKKWFYDMMVADALTGNGDRHGNNWGFIHNEASGHWRICPLFDNARGFMTVWHDSLVVQMKDDPELTDAVTDEGNKLYLRKDGLPIQPSVFFSMGTDLDLNKALMRMKVHLKGFDIGRLLANTEGLNDDMKASYKAFFDASVQKVVEIPLEQNRYRLERWNRHNEVTLEMKREMLKEEKVKYFSLENSIEQQKRKIRMTDAALRDTRGIKNILKRRDLKKVLEEDRKKFSALSVKRGDMQMKQDTLRQEIAALETEIHLFRQSMGKEKSRETQSREPAEDPPSDKEEKAAEKNAENENQQQEERDGMEYGQ